MAPQLTEVQAFEDLLTAEKLSELMRSTWTWDDRALRHDLADLLVDLDAEHTAAANAETADHAEALQARALAVGAEFVATVLGPNLMADTGNRARQHFVAGAVEPARFVRAASSAFAAVRKQAPAYAARHAAMDYTPESTWTSLLGNDGNRGLASAMRAYGYDLCASGFFATAGLAWQALHAIETESDRAAGYAKAIETEGLSATVAVAEQSGSWDPALVRAKAVRGASDWQISGAKLFVPAADHADVILVIARSIAGPSLFAVERTAPGLRVTPLSVIDETRPLYAVELADTPATLLGAEGGGGRLIMTAIDLACTALAGEQVGLIEKAMRLLGPASTSEDQLAEVTLDHVAAMSLWRRAVSEQAAGSVNASSAAAAAHIGCSRAAVHAATVAAAVVGPSEETDELLRRSLSANLLFGGPALSHERLLDRLGV